MSNQSCLCPAP